MMLSADEAALMEGHEAKRRERHELFLYEHLSVAARERERSDKAKSFGDYAEAERVRSHALAQASHHYRALLNMGGVLDPLLARMAQAERLTP